jgi:hypothetical protein
LVGNWSDLKSESGLESAVYKPPTRTCSFRDCAIGKEKSAIRKNSPEAIILYARGLPHAVNNGQPLAPASSSPSTNILAIISLRTICSLTCSRYSQSCINFDAVRPVNTQSAVSAHDSVTTGVHKHRMPFLSLLCLRALEEEFDAIFGLPLGTSV